jgi:hypothetical protein
VAGLRALSQIRTGPASRWGRPAFGLVTPCSGRPTLPSGSRRIPTGPGARRPEVASEMRRFLGGGDT